MKGQAALKSPRLMALLIVLCLVLLPMSAARSAENGGFQFKKIGELQRIEPKKPVRIKLKRTVKGQYSWELSGDDVNEILKVDRELRKVLRPQHEQEKQQR